MQGQQLELQTLPAACVEMCTLLTDYDAVSMAPTAEGFGFADSAISAGVSEATERQGCLEDGQSAVDNHRFLFWNWLMGGITLKETPQKGKTARNYLCRY